MAETSKQEVPTYPAERLTAEAYERFGEPPHVVAGALSAVSGSRKNFTIDQAKKAIDAFKSHPVEVDNPIGILAEAGEED